MAGIIIGLEGYSCNIGNPSLGTSEETHNTKNGIFKTKWIRDADPVLTKSSSELGSH
jgi:hypothetical protein